MADELFCPHPHYGAALAALLGHPRGRLPRRFAPHQAARGPSSARRALLMYLPYLWVKADPEGRPRMADEQGIAISSRGRIPADILSPYSSATAT